jgi:cytochrome c556
MTRLLGGLILSLAVVLVVAGVSAGADDKEAKEAQKEIVELAKLIENGKDAKAVSAKVEAIKKKYDDLNTVMYVFKPLGKSGLGYDDTDKLMGLELKIQRLEKGNNPIPTKTLKDEASKLNRLAYVSIAMAELAKPYFSKPEKGKTKKDWDKHNDDQKKAAEELIKAVKAGDGKAAKTAMKALNNACLGCHSDFRTSN